MKGLIDRMVALQLIENDACVWRLSVKKWWGDKPGIRVAVYSETAWKQDKRR